jgi:membrane associated rhomboid family serine protease
MSFVSEIKESFRESAMTAKLIYINIALFLVVRLSDLLVMFGLIPNGFVLSLFAMPMEFDTYIYKPWTLFTYMFCQYDFLHLLLNMLCLHWFGRLFSAIIGEYHLLSTYIIGGLVGGVTCFIGLAVMGMNMGLLLGASAAVLSLLIAVAFMAPNYSVHIVFVGNIRLKYYALIMVLVDLICLPSFINLGGHFSHLGGMLAGLVLALGWKKNGISQRNVVMDWLGRTKKTKMKVQRGGRVMTDYEFNSEQVDRKKRVDRILDKIKASGYDSLTAQEKQILFEDSKKI